jgi:signal transduction histidine kinase
MRQRVVRVAVGAVAVALVLFAVPLAIMVRSAFFTQERGELERVALAAALHVGPQFASGDKVELPTTVTDNPVGVYDMKMRLRAGRGPGAADEVTRRAAKGVVADGRTGTDLVVAVPVTSGENVVGVVRASVADAVVWQRVILAWLVMTALAVASLLVAILVARRQAGLLSRPLEALSTASRHIAEGDLAARAELSSVPEIHRVAQTHNAMVSRLTEMIEKERHFSADASHQLRTPLTGLQLGLEAALAHPPADLRPVLLTAAQQVRELHRTVDEVLALARLGSDQWLVAVPRPLGQLMGEVESRWHGALAAEGRRLLVNLEPDVTTIAVPGSLVTQILNVLIDNGLRHGRGAVTLTARAMSDALAVDVVDEGSIAMESDAVFARGTSGGDGHGIGLALARSLAEASSGRLVLVRRSPATFTLFLPGDMLEARSPVGLAGD